MRVCACVCVGEIISIPWFSKELKNNLSKNNCLHGVILILLLRESIFVGWGSPFPIVLVPRHKLSLCHTSNKPYLLHYSFQVWQGFINSESFSYNDSLFILITTRKEDFRINSTFRLDLLVYLGLLNSDKNDSSISRIVIFGFLSFLLFSS